VTSPIDDRTANLIRLLLTRLEYVAVDSHWAHRASGIRGGLIHFLERIEAGLPVNDRHINDLIDRGFEILEHAVHEKTGV
jgi:hypothetical protein